MVHQSFCMHEVLVKLEPTDKLISGQRVVAYIEASDRPSRERIARQALNEQL